MWRPPKHRKLLIFLPFCFLPTLFRTWLPAHRTLIIKLQGRLGNQLFQIAAGEYYASRHHTRPQVLYFRNNYSEETDLSHGIFRNLPHVDEPPCPARRIAEKSHACQPVHYFSYCALLEGLWQCPMYAEAGKDLIHRTLRNATGYNEAVAKMSALVNGFENVVVVHIRRGDYIKRYNKGLLEPLPLSYYATAAQRMPRPAVFAVFSDDPKWCRKQMTRWLDRGGDLIVFAEEEDNVKALIMMMQARYFIIANSTFSWWAAFLARSRVVVAPLKWFGKRITGGTRIHASDWILI